MTATLPQALDALAKATTKLAEADPSALKISMALAIGTALTALFTAVLAWLTYRAAKEAARSAKASEDMVNLERLREERQSQEKERERAEEQRRIAGALAAELRGLVARWVEIAPGLKANVAPTVWLAEQNYFAVFDSMGTKLLLLPRELAEEVVCYYISSKGAVDTLMGASRMTEYAALSPSPVISANLANAAAQQKAFGCEVVDRLMQEVEGNLLPKLDEAARGKSE